MRQRNFIQDLAHELQRPAPNDRPADARYGRPFLFQFSLPGVFFEVGFGGHFWLNILLTLLGYIPGIIHAVYVILTR